MRTIWVALFALSLLPQNAGAATAASAEKSTGVAAPVEQCIRNNAAHVEAAVLDLNAATDFLVSKVCAVPVAQETARQMQETQLRFSAKMKSACEDQKAKPADQPKTSLPGFDACLMQDYPSISIDPDEAQQGYDGIPTYIGSASASTIALASTILLDLRLSNSKSRQTH